MRSLLAVAANSRQPKHLTTINDLEDDLLHEMEHFFQSYHQAKGGENKLLGRVGSAEAEELHNQALPTPGNKPK